MNEAGVSLVLPQTGFAGHIHLARHGEPDLPRSDWLSRDGFNAWWEEYERVGLLASGSPPRLLQEIAERAAVIVTSHIPRARATAERIAGDCDIIVDEIYQEAPLPAPLLVPFLRATPPIWGTLARFAWWLGYADGGETRYEAELRVREAADRLIQLAADRDGDVLLCGHGWFIHMAARELKRRGWIKIKGGGNRFWDHKSFASPI